MAVGVPQFPGSLNDLYTLLPLGTGVETYLLQSIDKDATELRLGNTTQLTNKGLIKVGDEFITYDSIFGDTLYGLVRGAFQSDGGYPASAHRNGELVVQKMEPVHHRVHSTAIMNLEAAVAAQTLTGLADTDWDELDLETGNSIFWTETGTPRWIAYTPYFGDEANARGLWSATTGQVPAYDTETGEWTPLTVSTPGHTHVAADITDFTEAAQDVVGAFFADSTSIDVTYNDAGNALTAAVIYGGSGGTDGTANTAARSDHSHGALVPTGAIEAWALSTAPPGWALCDGAEVLRSSTLGALLVADGMRWGSGNGTTTVNLPNLKGRVPVGLNSADTDWDTLGETRGVKSVTLTAAESGLPQHKHAVSITSQGESTLHYHSELYPLRSGSVLQGNGGRNDINASGTNTGTQNVGHTHLVSGNTNDVTAANASSAHTNIQPSIVVNWIIKL